MSKLGRRPIVERQASGLISDPQRYDVRGAARWELKVAIPAVSWFSGQDRCRNETKPSDLLGEPRLPPLLNLAGSSCPQTSIGDHSSARLLQARRCPSLHRAACRRAPERHVGRTRVHFPQRQWSDPPPRGRSARFAPRRAGAALPVIAALLRSCKSDMLAPVDMHRAGKRATGERRRDSRVYERQPVQMRRLSQHRRRDRAREAPNEEGVMRPFAYCRPTDPGALEAILASLHRRVRQLPRTRSSSRVERQSSIL